MLFRQVHQTARSRTFIFWIVFALLFGQGLRVCMHALDGDGSTYAAPVHVESVFAGTEDSNPSGPCQDMLLPALLKTAVSTLLFCALVAVLFLFFPATRQRHSPFWKTCLIPLPSHHWLTPPGHAPPR